MPTKTPLEEHVYFTKGLDGEWREIIPGYSWPNSSGSLKIDTLEDSSTMVEKIFEYLREDARATNEAYMRQYHTIKKVIFSGPATIVIWMDGTKTIVKCMEGDIYDQEKALMMCIMERLLGGSKMEVKRFFKKWIPEDSNDVELDFDIEKTVKTIVEGAKKVLEDTLGGI